MFNGDDERVLGLVEHFCRRRGVGVGTRFSVAPSLANALYTLSRKGPDKRWATIACRADPTDIPAVAASVETESLQRQVLDLVVREEYVPRPREARTPWFLRPTVTSVAHWARVSVVLRHAYTLGLGWLIPAHKHVILVPLPRMSLGEGRTDLLHDDTGRPAVEWTDDTGYYFLHGARFDPTVYKQVINSELSLAQLISLPSVDHRSIALSYLTIGDLVGKAGARLIDLGARGTALYRLPLPWPMLRDRPPGYGEFDYFIHMRDASHPDREFIEWVDPSVGLHADAELCQAHAFGISLDDWLSIEQSG